MWKGKGIVPGEWDELGAQPGWYALSVNEIYGRSRQYRYFLEFESAAMAGYSIYIYHITSGEANRVRRELGLPALKEEEAGGGRLEPFEREGDKR